jgi:hypothetical protein
VEKVKSVVAGELLECCDEKNVLMGSVLSREEF